MAESQGLSDFRLQAIDVTVYGDFGLLHVVNVCGKFSCNFTP